MFYLEFTAFAHFINFYESLLHIFVRLSIYSAVLFVICEICVEYSKILHYQFYYLTTTSVGGDKTPFSLKRYWSHVFLYIFWAMIPKIIVVLAENQYLGRFWGVLT